jgi:hypothetical protein
MFTVKMDVSNYTITFEETCNSVSLGMQMSEPCYLGLVMQPGLLIGSR